MKSKEKPAIKIITSANPHRNNGFPLGLYWNKNNPQIANIQIIIISNPVKIVMKLNLNNKVLKTA